MLRPRCHVPDMGYVVLGIVITLFLMIPIFISPILPIIDIYNHLSRYYILSNIEQDRFLAVNYQSNWHFLANLGFDPIGVWLISFIPPLLVGKIIVVLIVMLQFGGVLFLNRALTGETNLWTIFFGAALSYSFILGWGFINYLLGNALALWTLGYWVLLRDRPLRAILVCAPLALLVLMCHAFAFGLYGLVAGALEFGMWLNRRPLRPAQLVHGFSLLAIQAMVPLALFFSTSTAHSTANKPPLTSHAYSLYQSGDLGERVWLQVLQRGEALFRVAETPWPSLDLALFLGTMVLVGIGLAVGAIRFTRIAWPAIALCALLIWTMPNGMFGAGHLAERIPLLFCLVAAAAIEAEQTMWTPWLVVALAAITLSRFTAIDLGWKAYHAQYAHYREVTAALPRHSRIGVVLVKGNDMRDGLTPRCEMFAPLAVIERHAATPIFANPTQQPLLLRPPLKRIADAYPDLSADEYADLAFSRRTYHYDDTLSNLAQSEADYILICGASRLRRPIPESLHPIAERGNISLYRVR